MPELEVEKLVVGYASPLERFDVPNHDGLVGLPFLREFDSWGKKAGQEGFHLGKEKGYRMK